jgi:serine/threonine protein kinase
MAGQNGLLPANPETDLELLGPDRVRVKRLLGTGAFASVYLAELTADGQTQQVALKVAKSPTSLAESSNQERLFTKEALVMQLMNRRVALAF